MSESSSSGPNPLCEIGRTHPRDRHRMRPVDGMDLVWYCPKHDLYAQVVDSNVADDLDRGDSYPLPDGSPGTVLREGDERNGGRLIYVRSER